MASGQFVVTNPRAQPAAYDFPSRNPASLYIPPEQYSQATFLRPNDYYGLPSQTVQYLKTPSGKVLKPRPTPINKRGSGFGYKDGEPFVRYEMPASTDIYNPQSTPRVPPGQDVTIQSYRSTFGDSVIPKFKPLSIVDALNAELRTNWSPQDIQPVVASRQPAVMNRSNRPAPSPYRAGSGFISGQTRMTGPQGASLRGVVDPTMSKAPMKHDYVPTCGGSVFVDPINRVPSACARTRCAKTLIPEITTGGDFLPPNYSGGDFLPPNYRGGDFLPPNYRIGRGMKKTNKSKRSKKSKKAKKAKKTKKGKRGGQLNPFLGLSEKIILP